MKRIAIFLGVLLATAQAWAADIALVGGLTGDVVLWREGKAYRLNRGNALHPTDELETRADGKIRVLFKDDSVLTIGPRSRVKLTAYDIAGDNRSFSLDVVKGRFKIAVAKWFLGATDGKIQTPTAVAGVRGTVVWGDTELDAICALEGNVEVQSQKGSGAKGLKGGECVAKMGEGKAEAISPSAEDLRKFLGEVTLP